MSTAAGEPTRPARIPFALADDGYLPQRLTQIHPRWKTPWISIAVSCVICSVFAWGGFEDLVVIDVIVYTAAIVLQMLALVNLRRRRPDLRRPFRIKGGWPAIAAVVLVPTVVYAVGLYYLVVEEGWIRGVGWSVGAMLTGVVVYPVARRYKRRGMQDRTWRIEDGVPTSNDGRIVGDAGVERNEVTP